MIPLFDAYPMLAQRQPYQKLGSLPTPVGALKRFGRTAGIPNLHIKRDDLSGRLYGGNKLRSLEFLLGSANRDGGNHVVGLAGTNLALAANVYARELDIPLKTFLVRQQPTLESRRNLRYFLYLDADLEEIPGAKAIGNVIGRYNQDMLSTFGRPAFALDSNSLLGMSGYVNAGFELAGQIEGGSIPEPDRIYLAAAMLGTASGLLLGLCAAGVDSQVVVVSHDCTGPEGAERMTADIRIRFEALAAYLQVLAPDFPLPAFDPGRLEVVCPSADDPLEYVRAGLNYQEELTGEEDIRIEATWTAQVIGAIVRHATDGRLADGTTLFWHTNGAQAYPDGLSKIDYHRLPQVFWRHFETDDLAVLNKPA